MLAGYAAAGHSAAGGAGCFGAQRGGWAEYKLFCELAGSWTWKLPAEDATIDRLIRAGRRCINGGLDRQQAVADDVPFDGGQGHDGDLATRQIFLVRHGLVSGEEDFETVALSSSQKLAIFESRQALVTYREHFVIAEMVP